ncbi:MAG: M23 family metallopeptidase [Ruminococcaceae bacterium]|nr:M23 family metallopeptidase [Oscillospiraceae bacterium]
MSNVTFKIRKDDSVTDKFRFPGRKSKKSRTDREKNPVGRMWNFIQERAENCGERVMFRQSFFLYAIIFIALCCSVRLDFGYRVVVNGKSFGVVGSQAMARTSIFTAYDEIVAVKGMDYKFENASFHLVPVSSDMVQSEELVKNKITAAFDGLTPAYGIMVDGKVVVALQSEQDGYDALAQIEEKYQTESGETHFANSVIVEPCRVQKDLIMGEEDAIGVLNGTKDARLTHKVAAGETFSSIALDYGVGTQQLLDANPGIVPEYLQQGATITVMAPQPLVAVESTEVIRIEEQIPFAVEEQPDASMYEGTRQVVSAGILGKKDVEYEITRVNHTVTDRKVLSETVLSEPVTEVVIVGTKEKPKNAPTGVMMRPYYGAVTARFGSSGSRWASTHTGIDYAGSTGDSVVAADGGTVTFAGWNGSYGKMIKISHGNGLETCYAHLSSISVTYGQQVGKGSHIGAIGNTGNSTGPHLHFEVRKNGVCQNPSNYVN